MSVCFFGEVKLTHNPDQKREPLNGLCLATGSDEDIKHK